MPLSEASSTGGIIGPATYDHAPLTYCSVSGSSVTYALPTAQQSPGSTHVTALRVPPFGLGSVAMDQPLPVLPSRTAGASCPAVMLPSPPTAQQVVPAQETALRMALAPVSRRLATMG